MPDILIRNLDEKTTKRLKARALANRRSLQAEVKEMIERAASEKTFDELRADLEMFSRRFKSRRMTETVRLIREDRKR